MELSAEWIAGEHFTFGPGIDVGVDGHPDTPNFGGGFLLLFA